MASEAARQYDIIVWGATGFTGRLVAAHLLSTYRATGALRWALGGRNRDKLQAVREALAGDTGGSAGELPLVVGDSGDDGFLAEMAVSTRVVCTTVGPYAKYGSGLVAACAAAGTHYCDLTGEPQWMRRMLDTHLDAAVQSGARIVFNCGFDCIPSDLGTLFVQDAMQAQHGVHAAHVGLRVAGMGGGASGGTFASMVNVLAEAEADPAVQQVLRDPYGLNPAGQRSGPDAPERNAPRYDEDFQQWVAPFVMAAINTKVVRRSNALLDYAWGRDFRYDEGVLTGAGPAGMLRAAAMAGGGAVGEAALSVGPIRKLVAGRLPAPGTGPSPRAREAGYFKLRLSARHPTEPGKSLFATVTGDRDPGYGCTSRMLGQSAACLAQDPLSVGGGMWTPATAMGQLLIARLVAKAGLTFTLDP